MDFFAVHEWTNITAEPLELPLLAPRPPIDYRRLAHEMILARAEWRSVSGQPQRRPRRLLSRLIDAALDARPAAAEA